jgi:RecB family endonuclease NucS
MVQVDAGDAVKLEPVVFNNRVSEAQLEKWLLANPELAGEPLLILGSQLAEFAEDKDRLDVLAVDKRGEIVLFELKVDGQFRLTELQALAYAAGYAGMPAVHFA